MSARAPQLAPVSATALDGEPLDALIFRAIGQTAGVVEELLATTPGLAGIALALPAGFAVTIPAPPSTAAIVDVVQLWD